MKLHLDKTSSKNTEKQSIKMRASEQNPQALFKGLLDAFSSYSSSI